MQNGYDFSQIIPSLSPYSAVDLDPDEAVASGDPAGMLAAKRAGVPYQAKPGMMAMSATPSTPMTQMGGQQVPSMPSTPQPANNAPNPPSEAPKTPAVPASVTPSGMPQTTSPWSDYAKTALEGENRNLQAAENAANAPGPDLPNLENQRASVVAAAPNPNDQQYRPTAGRRILRGLAGAGLGLVQHGILGAAAGAINPALVGGSGYDAPNSRFSRAQAQNQQQQQSLDQQIQDAESDEKDREENIKGRTSIAAGYGTSAQRAGGELNTQAKQQQYVTTLAKAGLLPVYGEDGQITGSQEDPNSPFTQQRRINEDLQQAKTQLEQANAAVAAAKNDPNSPAYRLAVQKEQTAQQNADAAGLRAKAYWGNYLSGSLGIDLSGKALPGATELPDDTPVGTHLQGSVQKQQGNVAQFNDVLGATDHLEDAAKKLVRGGGTLNSPRVAAAIADPKTTSSQWAQGQFVNSGLSPAERDYVTQVKAYRENLQALRKSTGGGVSDAQVNRLMEMAPGANTPDLDYLLRQTGQIRQTAGRLAEGIPNVQGGHRVRGAGGGDGSMPPQSVVDGMKNGQYVHGPGGSYQKQGGKLVPVGQ